MSSRTRGVPRKRRQAGAVRPGQFADRGIVSRELPEPALRSVAWCPGSDARHARRQIPGLLIRRPAPTQVVIPAITNEQETATDGVQFQEDVNVRKNIFLSRSGTSVSSTGAADPREPRARKAALMILFVAILVLAFAAYLNVTPSAAIDGAQSAATSGLSSWNPNVTCAADLVTIQDVLGSAYPHQALSGSRYQHNATSGGIPLERSLSPPCTITNITGAVLSPFVQINGVSLYGYGVKTTDCSGWYSKQNGGQRYPGNKTFCTNAGQIITLGTTSGYMKIEIDRDWLGKGYCGPNVPSCNNETLGQEQSNGSISLDVQGFVFWEGPYHWELHPFTAWKLSNSPPPPPPNSPPSAPQNLAATGGNAQVTLTWQAPASNGGSPITNYKIYRGGAPSTETLLTTVGAVTSYTDTAVTNGVTYYYQVSAVNNVGEGPRSNEASATPSAAPPPPSPPSAPQNLAATGGNAQVTLTWQAPASNGGSPITNYKIYRGGAPSTETLLTTVGNVLTYTDSAVTNGVTYYYQVSAVNSPGEGAKSNEASSTPNAPPPPPTPPSAPTNLVATGGNAQVTLTWQAPASNGGSPITNYRIYRGTSSNGETLKATIGNVLTYTDTTVTNGVTYYYQVSAVNAAGEGPRSNEASATPSAPPPPSTPPSAPTNLVATVGNAQVGLTWQAPASNGGSPITNYKIYRGTTSGGETLVATIGNQLSYSDGGLTNGVTYYYQVSAVNNVGEGPRSNEISATPTAPATPPGAPQGLVATAGDATVTLTWSAPSSNGGSPITNYRIYRSTTGGGETLQATIGNVLTYSDTSVTNGVTYYYQVSAVSNVGEGPRSNEASATPTAPAGPPGAPQGLVATAGDATVTLTWSAPSSNGGSPITNYRIYRGTASGGETLKATIGNVLTYSDTSVTNGVTYYYQVSAMNGAGEGPRSNEASATPSPPPPPPPDFGISATPASLSLQIGSSGTSTIALMSLNGFAGTIGLSTSIACSGLCLIYPTASLNPTSVTLTSGGTGVSTLTVATSVLTTPGTYTITITATSGSITHTVTVTVQVTL